ncbi:MAG: type III-A CRISPR-associated RAMP protein Csm5 [Spirochaetes bacterium]|nr:type III-A CRISPR-associated RAMP protein Csm5 [Spirochaetota bacterium]
MKKYKIRLRPITFIHIGSGTTIDSLEYTFISSEFYRININQYAERIRGNYQKEFVDLIENLTKSDYKNARKEFINSLNENVKYLKKNNKGKGIISYIEDVCEDFGEIYNKSLDNIENQMLIEEMVRSPSSNMPYIPGSSLKGAIRTAILSYIINKAGLKKQDFNYNYGNSNREPKDNEIQAMLLGYYDAKSDPFKSMIITDSSIFAEKASIILSTYNYSINRKKKGKEAIMPMNILKEYIRRRTSENNVDDFSVDFKMIIKEEMFHYSDNIKKESRYFKNIESLFTKESISEACNLFYFNKLELDYSKYFKDIDKTINLFSKDSIENEVDKNSKNEFLIRLGMHGHFESKTMDEFRDPSGNKLIKNKNLSSRMLVLHKNFYYPIGWAKCTIEEIK